MIPKNIAIIGRKTSADSSMALPCCFFLRADTAIIVPTPLPTLESLQVPAERKYCFLYGV